MIRNQAGQAIGSQVIEINSGGAFPGPVTVYVTGDGGVQAIGAVNGGLCVHEGNGFHTYSPSQAETDFRIVAFTFTGAGAVPATVQVATLTEAQQAAASSVTVTTVIGDGPTRTELLNQLAHRLNKTPPPNMDSSTEARLASYLNQRHRRVLSMPGLTRLRDATVSFTTTPGEPHYGLPDISKISRLFETTNERVLWEMSLDEYRMMQPLPLMGTPEAFVWRGHQVVAVQPSQPTPLHVVSSNAADRIVVHIEGVTALGLATVGVVLDGTTPVNIAPTMTWQRIDKFYLTAPCIGHVSLVEVPGPTQRVLGTITAGKLTMVYSALTLSPTPSAAITYYVDITRAITDMVRGTDQAFIPPDFMDLLVLGALADEYQHLSDTRWSTAVTEYKEREHQLKYWLAETATGQPLGLTNKQQRPSQLGAWYPAGS